MIATRRTPLARVAGVVAPLAVVALLLAAWQAYVRLAEVDAIVLPAPTDVAGALWTDRSLLLGALGQTAKVVLLGIALAAPVGLAVAALVHRSRFARRALEPLLVGSQAIPVPILAPLLVVWLGFGLPTQLVIVVLVAFFPVAISTRDALAAVDGDTDLVLRNLGASGVQRLRFVELRGAVPGILTGLRLAVVFAVIGAVFADAAGSTATTADDPTSSGGLGRVVDDAIPQLATDRAFAAIVLLVVFSLLLFWSLGALQRRTGHTASTPPLRRTP